MAQNPIQEQMDLDSCTTFYTPNLDQKKKQKKSVPPVVVAAHINKQTYISSFRDTCK
jgi:hypothetical protein